MGSRGRKSSTELATRKAVGVVERPDAPLDLTPEQAEEWDKIANRKPADWFDEGNYVLLTQYCAHTVEARRLRQLIDRECAKEDLDLGTYMELLKSQRQETAALKTLASSMRLSQQSQYNAQSAATASKRVRTVSRPWESD